MHILNAIFDNIYVLYISDDEIFSIRRILEEKNITAEYFRGCNGYLLDPKNITNMNILKKGEYGHLNSFTMIIENAQMKKYKNILILEPDIYFCENFEHKCSTWLIPLLKMNNKLIYLGATQYKYYNEYTWPNINLNLNSGIYNPYRTLGTFAVSINCSVYDELLMLIKTYSKPTDVLFTQMQEKYQKESFVIYPNLICCNVVKSSTKNKINGRDQISFMKNVRWDLIKYNFVNYFEYNLDPNMHTITFNVNSKYNDFSIKIIDIDNTELYCVIANKNKHRQKYNNRYTNFIVAQIVNKGKINICATNIFFNSIYILPDKSKVLSLN